VRRVLIIGSPGAGKSTIAVELARRTGLPVIHLDQHYWRAGWAEPDKESWAADVEKLTAGERWIMDGNYSGTLEQRLKRADTVIDLHLPGWLCFGRVLRRTVSSHGERRSDMAEGCPERFDLYFLWWTLKYSFSSRKRVEQKLSSFSGKLIKLCSRDDVRRFLATFSSGG